MWHVLNWKLKERGLETWHQVFAFRTPCVGEITHLCFRTVCHNKWHLFIYLYFLNKWFRFQWKHCSYQYYDLNGWNWQAFSAFPASTVTGVRGAGAISAVSGCGAGLQPGQADGSSEAAQRHQKHLLALALVDGLELPVSLMCWDVMALGHFPLPIH